MTLLLLWRRRISLSVINLIAGTSFACTNVPAFLSQMRHIRFDETKTSRTQRFFRPESPNNRNDIQRRDLVIYAHEIDVKLGSFLMHAFDLDSTRSASRQTDRQKGIRTNAQKLVQSQTFLSIRNCSLKMAIITK